MKKYELLKDLPMAEAGTICHIENYRDDDEMPIVLDEENKCVLDTDELQYLRKHNKFDQWFELIGDKPWKPEDGEMYYFIGGTDSVYSDRYTSSLDDKYFAVGNYFKTREEAEKAVEKLKALKRLRDKGFKFADWKLVDHEDGEIDLQIRATIGDDSIYVAGLVLLYLEGEVKKDVDLLFKEESGEIDEVMN